MADAHEGGGGPAPAHDDEFWRQFERDYYALLGVARDASADAIRSRYMALSREFHPDRRRTQADAALAALANAQYPALDRAYKVLCDPLKRRVYNLYGERVRCATRWVAVRSTLVLTLTMAMGAGRAGARAGRGAAQRARRAPQVGGGGGWC